MTRRARLLVLLFSLSVLGAMVLTPGHPSHAVNTQPPGEADPQPDVLPGGSVDVPREALGAPQTPASSDTGGIGGQVQDVRGISGFNPLDEPGLRQIFNPGGTLAAPVSAAPDAPVSPWANNPGTYGASGGLCGIFTTMLTVSGTICNLSSIGSFDCSNATTPPLSPLTILGMTGQSCFLTRITDKSFGLVCSNPCSDTFTRP